ncbi:transposase [Natrinema pellirubrum DSM 15624]|uniref:Transposase n=3 Tax=Natrinema pellirubrum (strain DSM 15624 / CIP 106293 / JCM 10476 / NCIMB 786 / 157) TaxID=797303 RepID=G4GNM7_NATP1|nr:IS6 family transposase [Natrinema pellirubrum]AGB30226.1 transposase [Natrinema pellirubrum DSM 15624]AGB31844.1 transposase [Natrinema pellirubrum DSM 15624]AGB33538.1 transposase [Natrinema pellirubrum DSM 15624]
MLETARLNRGSDCFELDFLEREATPEPAMKLGIRLHLAGLSLSDTISILERLGVERCRSTVHNWVQKADLQPLDGANPDHVAVDETVIQLNDERFWLYAAVDPATNRLLHVKLSPTRNQAITEMFLAELRDKHLVDDALFLVDSAPWLQAALHRHGLDYRYEKHGNRNSVERVFRELKRRTNQFSNCFSHAEADTVENWLQAFAFAWNQLI